jgi:hypothetical protein
MTNRTAELNDAFRATFVVGDVYRTCGICSMPACDQQTIMARVRAFNGFTVSQRSLSFIKPSGAFANCRGWERSVSEGISR